MGTCLARPGRSRCGATTTSSPSSPSFHLLGGAGLRPSGEICAAVLGDQPFQPDAAAPCWCCWWSTARMIENRLITTRYPQRPPAALPQPAGIRLRCTKAMRWTGQPHPGGQPQRAVPARPAVDGRGAPAPIEDLFETSLEDMLQRGTTIATTGGDLPRERGAALLRRRAGRSDAGAADAGRRWSAPRPPQRPGAGGSTRA